MQRSDWDQLAAPFLAGAVNWRVQEIAADGGSARLRPHLEHEAIRKRLDEVVGREGWSFRFRPFGGAVGCELEVSGVVKSAIVEPVRGTDGPEECGQVALARAAEHFGLVPPVDRNESYWVDYDPDDGTVSPDFIGQVTTATASQEAAVSASEERSETLKPAGQQAIDRLVERLKVEGSGLAAARLLVEYGGYGTDPETARELYGKLRELLARRVETAK